MKLRTAWLPCAFILGSAFSITVLAENAPPAGAGSGHMGDKPSPAEQAIKYRQSLYTLIGGNFGPIGGIMQGHAEYNATDVAKRAQRVAFLATMVGDAFPEISKDGNTKAKPEIWTEKEDFAKAVHNLEESTAALAALVKRDNTNSADFKAAVGKVGESCKGCHDHFRSK